MVFCDDDSGYTYGNQQSKNVIIKGISLDR